MARLRLLILGLSLFVLVRVDGWAPGRVSAQVVAPPQPGTTVTDLGQRGLNLADWSLVRNIQDIERRLNDGNSAAIALRLQQLLSQPQDGFYRPSGDESGRYFSLKRKAASLLQNAPPAVLKSYEVQFGAEAKVKLERARELNDAKLAQEVTQRYLHTNAGAEACYWLACQYLDQADYFTAAQYLNRLKSLGSGSRFEPRSSLRLALCWSRLGMREKATELIQQIQSQSPEPIQIGNHSLASTASPQQIQVWLNTVSRGIESISGPNTAGWHMARATPDRNPRHQSSPPVARTLWTVALNSWSVLNRKTQQPETISVAPQLDSFKNIHLESALTPLPSTIPLLVGDLVITRYNDHLSAINVQTGEEVWNTFERDRTFNEIRNSLSSSSRVSSVFNNNWNADYGEVFKILLRQRVWEDLTFGTISSDGEFVFAIEDMGFVNPIISEAGTQKPHPLAMKDYNRLCAYDVHSGMLRWELGGANSTIKLDQAGVFFLGPPLPVGEQLYCICEKVGATENQGFVQLLVLDAQTGKQLWSQSLSQPAEDLFQASHRRRAGLTPAMTRDLLVCPTGSGYVVAVDVGTRSLAWAYHYGTLLRDPNNALQRLGGRRPRSLNSSEMADFNAERPAYTNEWQDASPILTDSHVILTPRDSNELHCLSLDDGELKWRVTRGEAQYVACVRDDQVVIVNQHSVEALRLSDGKPAWPVPVPVINQTGRGITTDTHLVLPLVNGKVVNIELKTGRKFYSRVRAADQEPLGNLIPGPGIILSQSPSELTAFRTLEAVYPQAIEQLAKNPQDAGALALRGEYRLSLSEIAEGQADLRASIKAKASADAEFLLFDSLLESLQVNFAANRGVMEEAEKLARTSSQKSNLYRIWAEGLRKIREHRNAFTVLDKLNRSELGKPELERVDGYHSIRRDYWTRSELHQLLAESSQADREHFQTLLKSRLDAAKTQKSDEDLRHLTRFLGPGTLGDAARLALAERLMKVSYSLEVEQLLSGLSRHSDRQISGRAVALMVLGMIRLERGEEAASLILDLERSYADAVCHEKKTGKQLAAEWRAAGLTKVANADNWPTGRVEVLKEVLERADRGNFEIPVDTAKSPFYKEMQMRLELGSERLLGVNNWGKPRFAMPISELKPIPNASAMNAQVRNHVVLLNTGLKVIALDTLTEGKTLRAQKIWSSPLVDGPMSEENQAFHVARPRPGIGRPRMAGMDRWRNVIGTINAIEDDTLCILRGRHLVLLDIMTGDTLWKRTNIDPASEMFGNADSIFVIGPQSPVANRFRRSDGVALGEVKVPDAISRIQTFGDRILSSTNDPKLVGQLILKLDDLTDGKTVWEHPFPINTQLSLVDDTQIALLEPNGMLSYLQVSDGKPLWTLQLPPVVRPKDLYVLPDGDRLLVMRDEIPPLQPIIAVNGMQFNVIYGNVDCLDRATGKVIWSRRIEHFALDPSMPAASPFWFFSGRALANLPNQSEIRMLAIDKRTGRVAFQSAEKTYGHGFDFAIDPKEKHVDVTLLGSQQPVRYRLKLTDQAWPEPVATPPKGEEEPPKQKSE